MELLKLLDPRLARSRASTIERIFALNLSESAVTDDELKCIAGATGLRVLNLRDTSITGKGLRHLASLQSIVSLDVAGTRISDEDLGQLSCLRSLQSLMLNRTTAGARVRRGWSGALSFEYCQSATLPSTTPGSSESQPASN